MVSVETVREILGAYRGDSLNALQDTLDALCKIVLLESDIEDRKLAALSFFESYARERWPNDETLIRRKENERRKGQHSKCKCGKKGAKVAMCPYALEIAGAKKPCNCCFDCRKQCEQDI